ncbi:hypothetical protein PHMEG_00027518 [Phytophthora megakarya]|uniref:Uncharacterized protein n=1 Tax=Phytophthora megakarya TaxID=4795 RepID=A0A225V8P0_9STRA|nr:hypothetical protein PHMEG_00027518 [Phytophthora megakarya]
MEKACNAAACAPQQGVSMSVWVFQALLQLTASHAHFHQVRAQSKRLGKDLRGYCAKPVSKQAFMLTNTNGWSISMKNTASRIWTTPKKPSPACTVSRYRKLTSGVSVTKAG